MRGPLIISFFILLFVGITNSFAQTKEELQERIRQAENEIRIANQLLDRTRNDQKLSSSELKVIRNRIANRKKIITTLDAQMAVIESDMREKNSTVRKLNQQLETLKKEYAEMVVGAYRNYKLNNATMFLFSAEDFNQAMRRIDFMRRYNSMREVKASEINALKDSINRVVTELDRTRLDLDNNKSAKSSEISTLSKDENQYQTKVTQLKKEETRLAKEVETKQKEIEKAEKRIQELIAEEARRNSQAKTSEAETARNLVLSGKFEQNKGKLPYPVSGGVIIDKFGEHAHSVVKTSKIVNKGINISAAKGAEVRSVFEGTVTAIFNASVLNNCIIVRHGDHVSVYANVVSVSVKTGDKVRLNQRLGRLSESNDPETHFLHFEILENGTHVNPELWIKR